MNNPSVSLEVYIEIVGYWLPFVLPPRVSYTRAKSRNGIIIKFLVLTQQ